MESSQLSCDARFTESIKLAQSVDAERINCGVMTAAEFCSVREEPVRVGRAWRSVVSVRHFGGTILSSAGLDLRPLRGCDACHSGGGCQGCRNALPRSNRWLHELPLRRWMKTRRCAWQAKRHGKCDVGVPAEPSAAAEGVLHTVTKKDTVNAALAEVVALAARRGVGT